MLNNKFDSKQCLFKFQSSVWDHLIMFGLDTVAYFPDPRSVTGVLNLVMSYTQFIEIINQATKSSHQLVSLFGIWDSKYYMKAKCFFIDSLSAELKRDFEAFHDKDINSFAITQLKLLHYLLPSKISDMLKCSFRNIKLQQPTVLVDKYP